MPYRERDVGEEGRAGRAGAKPPQYYRPAEGEIDDVVQAHPDDRREKSGADAWQQCRYEVVLAHVDDTTAVEGAPRPPDRHSLQSCSDLIGLAEISNSSNDGHQWLTRHAPAHQRVDRNALRLIYWITMD